MIFKTMGNLNGVFGLEIKVYFPFMVFNRIDEIIKLQYKKIEEEKNE